MIEAKTINLRNIEEGDIDLLLGAFRAIQKVGDYWPINLKSKIKFKEDFEKSGFWDEKMGSLLVEDKQGGPLGVITYFEIANFIAGYEIGGFMFDPEKRGQGVMTEALKVFCAYLFELKPIPRIQVGLIQGNQATLRVAEKCGFTHEGTLRNGCFHRGEYRNLEQYSLLREECPSLKQTLADL